MLTATTSTRSNRSIFVPRDTGSPNDGLLKHISNLGSIARLDFERYSVAGEVIYAIEGDTMPTSQQDEEARIGTLAYALKKLNPTNVHPTGNASDPAPTVRAFGEVPSESRAYSEYLKRLNEIDRQLLNEAVNRRKQYLDQTATGESRDPLSIKEARALLPVEECTEIRQRARNRAWYQFAPETAFASEPEETALRLSDLIARLQEKLQPRAVVAAQVLCQFITDKTGFSYEGGPIPETVWERLDPADAQQLMELDDYATRTRDELYWGFETLDALLAAIDGVNPGIYSSASDSESPATALSLTEESRDSNPTEDAAEFIRYLNIICDESDARGRQTIASYYYNEISNRGVRDVLRDMGLLAMQLASLNSTVEITETDETDAMGHQSDSNAIFDSEKETDSEARPSLFDQELATVIRLIGGCGRGAWIEEPDDASRQENRLDQYDEGGAIVSMSSHERTIACGRIDQELSAEDLPECARHLAGQLRRDYANGLGVSQIWSDINAELEELFPVRIEKTGRSVFISHANATLQEFSREVLEAILDECQQDFHLSALHNNPVYRSFHKAIRKAVDTRIVGKLMQRAYEARQSGIMPVKQFIALKTASTLQRERLLSARLSQTALRLIKEIDKATPKRLKYLSWALYGDNQPAHPIHSLSGQDTSRVWSALKARQQKIAVPNRAA
jgi:hypothetical protein